MVVVIGLMAFHKICSFSKIVKILLNSGTKNYILFFIVYLVLSIISFSFVSNRKEE